MQAGDVFTLDQEALDEMEKNEYSVIWKDKSKNIYPLPVGTQFRITTKGLTALPVEVRAAKIDPVTNKCGKGRPRRFPAGAIYRLLGETAPDPADYSAPPVDAPAPAPVASTVETPLTPVYEALVVDKQPSGPQRTEEEREAAEARVAGLLGKLDDNTSSSDW
jgi:hypothetical protein